MKQLLAPDFSNRAKGTIDPGTLRKLFLVALAVRVIFAFFILPKLPGTFSHVHPDTHTYLNAFLNLLDHGRYCFLLDVRDSCFYRLPTYPFFLGMNHLVAGPLLWASVTLLQAALDALTCCLAVLITARLKVSTWGQRCVTLFFLVNPFTLFWIPVQMPEILGVFLVVAATYGCLPGRCARVRIFFAAVATVLAVWTKQYIAAFLPAALLFLLARDKPKNVWRSVAVFYLIVVAIHSIWVLRNYVNYSEIIPMSGNTTGDKHYLADYSSAMAFYALFYVNYNSQIADVVKTGTATLPQTAFVARHQQAIDGVTALANKCGPSFRTWRGEYVEYDDAARECERRVAEAYRALTRVARQEMGVWEFYRTSVLGFAKAITKYDMGLEANTVLIHAPLFLLRFLLLMGAFASFFAARSRIQRYFSGGTILFWLSTAGVLSFVFRHVEMRYLLMADMLMYISASITIDWLQERREKRRSTQPTAAIGDPAC